MENKDIVSTTLTVLPAIIMPLVLWYLNRNERSSDQKQINYYIKRLELLEKLRDFDFKLPKESSVLKNSLLKKEISCIQDYLFPPLDEKEEKKLLDFDYLSKFRRVLLLFKPASFKVFLIQLFFFYIFLGILATPPFMIFRIEHLTYYKEFIWIQIIVIVFYIILLFILSKSANRLQKRRLLRKT